MSLYFLLLRRTSLNSSLSDLSRVTVKRNVELENTVAKLQAEIELWKDHHATMQMEANAHKVQLATLNKQVSNMDVFRGVRLSFIRSLLECSFCALSEPGSTHSLCY